MFLICLKHWSVQNLSCRLRGSVYKFVMSYQSIESSQAETGSQCILSLIKMYKVLIDNKKIPMKTWSPCMDQLTLIHKKAKSVQKCLQELHLYLPGSRINATKAVSLSPQTRCSQMRKESNLQSRKRLRHSYHFSSGLFFVFPKFFLDCSRSTCVPDKQSSSSCQQLLPMVHTLA